MRVQLFLGVLLCSLLIGAGQVAAQDFLEERLDGVVKRQIRAYPAKALTNKNIQPSPLDKLNHNPNKTICPGGADDCVDETYTQQEIIAEQGQGRKATTNFYGSMAGFSAGMNSPFHVDATVGGGSAGSEGYLDKKLTLAYITIGLTEPAVAAGLSQALNYVGHDVNNRLQSEQTFFSQLAYMPDVSESLGQAYIACISQKMQDGGEGHSWLTAQAACSGDTAKLQGTKGEFKDESNGTSTLMFDKDPNWQSSSGGGSDPLVIKLSDYLFNRDENNQGTKDFKKSFVEFVGDVEYRLDPADQPKKQGTRELVYKKLKPTNPDQTFEARYRNQAENVVYAGLLDSFQQACDHDPTDPQSAEQGDAFLAQIAGGGDNNWATKLGYPGFSADSTLMRMLWELSLDPAAEGCPDYQSQYAWDQVVQDPASAPEAARDYLFITERIAFGRVFSLYILVENYLRKTNVGQFNSFARQGAFELLYEAAGTSDLRGVLEQNTISLRSYLKSLEERTAHRKQFNKNTNIGARTGEASQLTSGINNAIGE